MPHSGGGGSHSGGFSSSDSSSSSGSDGSVSLLDLLHIFTALWSLLVAVFVYFKRVLSPHNGQSAPFNGASRYVYYYRGRPRMYYSIGRLSEEDISSVKSDAVAVPSLITGIPGVVLVIYGISSSDFIGAGVGGMMLMVWFSIKIIKSSSPSRHQCAKLDAVRIDWNPDIIRCDSCNGQIVVGTVDMCPYCNRHIPNAVTRSALGSYIDEQERSMIEQQLAAYWKVQEESKRTYTNEIKHRFVYYYNGQPMFYESNDKKSKWQLKPKWPVIILFFAPLVNTVLLWEAIEIKSVAMLAVAIVPVLLSILVLVIPLPRKKLAMTYAYKCDGELEYIDCPSCNGVVVLGDADRCPHCGEKLPLSEERQRAYDEKVKQYSDIFYGGE